MVVKVGASVAFIIDVLVSSSKFSLRFVEVGFSPWVIRMRKGMFWKLKSGTA